MKKLVKISLVSLLVGVILMFAGLCLTGFDFKKLSPNIMQTNTYEISESFENISIDARSADVRFAPSTNGKCTVVFHENKGANHTISVSNNTLAVQATQQKWYAYIGINVEAPSITIYLPESELNSLIVKTNTGDVNMPSSFTCYMAVVETNTGDVEWNASVHTTLSITTDTGDVKTAGMLATAIDLETDTGEIELSNVQCQTLSLEADTGDIDCENVIVAGKISIQTNTGDVDLEGCDASSLWIKTSTGDVRGRLLTDKTYVYKTSTGKVRVPDTTGGRCEITTSTGDIYFR